MNGFVLNVNNYPKKSVFHEKTPSIAAKPHFSSRAKLKISVAASRNSNLVSGASQRITLDITKRTTSLNKKDSTFPSLCK